MKTPNKKKTAANPRIEVTQYGFTWGAAEVRRYCDDNKGNVWFGVHTKRGNLEIRVTPSGLIRCSK